MSNHRTLVATIIYAVLAWPAGAAEPTLRVAVQKFPEQLGNPYAPIALPNTLVIQAIFDPLTQVGPNGEVIPKLATGWVQESPTTWAFMLRPDVIFSNGEAFDADAVIAALTYLQTEEGRRDSVASQDLKVSIASFRARDARTVEIVTREPDPILPLHLSFLRIPPPQYWAKLGRVAFQRAPIGTGPFKVDRWDEARIELSAFAGSWRPPLIARLQINEISDPTVRLQAFVSESVDIATALAPGDEESVASAGGRLYSRSSPVVNFLLFVTVKDTPLKDVRVQRALNYAVDKETILTAFLAGAVKPVGQFSHPMAFGFNPEIAPYPYDPAKARALLAGAGYPNGFAFTMIMDTSSGGSYTDWYQRIAQDFAAVGVAMTIRTTTTPRMIESVQTGNWPVEAFAWTFAGFDSLRSYRFRACTWTAPYHCDPEMTPLIAAAQRATTAAERLTTIRAALAHEHDHPPGVMLWPNVGFDGIAKHVEGYVVEEDVIRWELVRFK